MPTVCIEVPENLWAVLIASHEVKPDRLSPDQLNHMVAQRMLDIVNFALMQPARPARQEQMREQPMHPTLLRLHLVLGRLLLLFHQTVNEEKAPATDEFIDLRRAMELPRESYGDKPNGEWWE